MDVMKLEVAGSFHEVYNSGALSPFHSSNSGVLSSIFPIYFYPIFEKLLRGKKNNLAISWQEIFEQEYIYATQFQLTSLCAFYELPSKRLAGFVNIADDDSDAIKTQKLLENYSKFQKIGLKLWIKQNAIWRNTASYADNSVWHSLGETILQNKGIQMKINLLPYLGATVCDMLEGGIGISFVDKGDGVLSGSDYLTLVGEWKATIMAFPRITGVINLVHVIPPAE